MLYSTESGKVTKHSVFWDIFIGEIPINALFYEHWSAYRPRTQGYIRTDSMALLLAFSTVANASLVTSLPQCACAKVSGSLIRYPTKLTYVCVFPCKLNHDAGENPSRASLKTRSPVVRQGEEHRTLSHYWLSISLLLIGPTHSCQNINGNKRQASSKGVAIIPRRRD